MCLFPKPKLKIEDKNKLVAFTKRIGIELMFNAEKYSPVKLRRHIKHKVNALYHLGDSEQWKELSDVLLDQLNFLMEIAHKKGVQIRLNPKKDKIVGWMLTKRQAEIIHNKKEKEMKQSLKNDDKFEPSSYSETKSINAPISMRIYEDNAYIIFTDYSSFILGLKDFINKHPHIRDDKKLFDLVEEKAKSLINEIDVMNICKAHNLYWRLEFRIADLLEKGKCQVFNKSTNRFASKIELNNHGYQAAPLVGSGGRSFFADGQKFFEVEDWIS